MTRNHLPQGGPVRLIETPYSKDSPGHYSPAVVYGGLVYVSGVLPIDYASSERSVRGDAAAQTGLALANLETVLKLAGSARELVLKTTVYVADVALWPEVNAAYAAFFGAHKPARSIVPAAGLHFGALVEIEAVAALG